MFPPLHNYVHTPRNDEARLDWDGIHIAMVLGKSMCVYAYLGVELDEGLTDTLNNMIGTTNNKANRKV